MSRNVLLMITPFSRPRLEGIAHFAQAHAWNLMMADRLAEEESPDDFDGILLTLRSGASHTALAKRLLASGVPAVDLTIERPEFAFPRAIADHAAIGHLAALDFTERGFTHFAWYSSRWSPVHALRFNGFAEGAPRGNKVVKLTPTHLAQTLPALPKPLAVLCYDDTDAARLVWTARRLGLEVPQDVAVVGIGNDPFLCENQTIPLSSVDQNLAQGAEDAAALLEEIMSAPPRKRAGYRRVPPRLTSPGEVVARASSDTLSHPDPVLRVALVYIHDHLHTSFGLTEVATALSVNRTKLSADFTAAIGHSLGDEILRQRIEQAKRLLKKTDRPLQQIAAACGFCNPAYFTNTFRRETGLTPKAWRRS